jgi:hypothetical protein
MERKVPCRFCIYCMYIHNAGPWPTDAVIRICTGDERTRAVCVCVCVLCVCVPV